MHGGTAQLTPLGDPRRGGRPVTTGLYVRHLRTSILEGFQGARPGTLDDEIRLAKALLDWAVEKFIANPTGGIPIHVSSDSSLPNSRKVVTFKPWTEVVAMHEDRVRRLEEARARITALGGAVGGDLPDLHDPWVVGILENQPNEPSDPDSNDK